MAALLDFSVDMVAGFYGAGIEKITEKLCPLPVKELYGKIGNIMGYNSIMTYASEERLSMVALVNYENDMQSMLIINLIMQALTTFKEIEANLIYLIIFIIYLQLNQKIF